MFCNRIRDKLGVGSFFRIYLAAVDLGAAVEGLLVVAEIRLEVGVEEVAAVILAVLEEVDRAEILQPRLRVSSRLLTSARIL